MSGHRIRILYIYLSIYPSINVLVCLSIYPCIFLSINLSISIYLHFYIFGGYNSIHVDISKHVHEYNVYVYIICVLCTMYTIYLSKKNLLDCLASDKTKMKIVRLCHIVTLALQRAFLEISMFLLRSVGTDRTKITIMIAKRVFYVEFY